MATKMKKEIMMKPAGDARRGKSAPRAAAAERFRPRPCYGCGQGVIAPRNAKGQTMAYKDAPAITLTRSVKVPMCDHCGEMLLDDESAAALDAALEQDYRAERKTTLQEDLAGMLQELGLQQNEVEMLCGLSNGYVSKVLRSEKEASPLLLRLVHIVRAEPRAALRALSQVTALPQRARELVGA